MGINAHAKVGDMGVVVAGNTMLYSENPEKIGINAAYDRGGHIIEAGTHCIILAKETAGSAKMGHVFMVLANNHIGWVWNYDLMVWYDL